MSNLIKQIKSIIGDILFYAIAPFLFVGVVEWVISNWKDKIPETWVRAWKEVRNNGLLCGVIVSVMFWASRYSLNDAENIFLDYALIVLVFHGLYSGLLKILGFLIIPETPGAFNQKVNTFWNRADELIDEAKEGFIKEKSVTKEDMEGDKAIDKAVLVPLKRYLLSKAKVSAKEALIRLGVIFLSVRFVYFVGYFIAFFAVIYHYLGLVSAHSFAVNTSSGGATYLDYIAYSMGFLGMTDFGLSAVSGYAKMFTVIQVVLAVTLLVVILPLVYLFYERNIRYSETSAEDGEGVLDIVRKASQNGEVGKRLSQFGLSPKTSADGKSKEEGKENSPA
ncbi:MAG: hypothetical protein AB7V08_03920 [Elusimicrobiales bacterium]